MAHIYESERERESIFLSQCHNKVNQFKYLAFFYVPFKERNAIYSDFAFEKQTLASSWAD